MGLTILDAKTRFVLWTITEARRRRQPEGNLDEEHPAGDDQPHGPSEEI